MFKHRLKAKDIHIIHMFAIYFATVLNLRFWQFTFQYITINAFNILVFLPSLLIVMLLPLYLLFNLIVFPRITKPLLALLLLLSSAANYFMFNYGVSIDKEMMRNVFETTVREAGDLITIKAFLYVFLTGIIPTIVLCLTEITYTEKKLKRRSIAVAIHFGVLLLLFPFTYKHYVSFGRNNVNVANLINTYNYIKGTIRSLQTKRRATREFVKVGEDAVFVGDSKETTLFVLVIGETARADNFSLGGGGDNKETNPLLKKQNVRYAVAKSCGTATAISVPCIFSSKSRKDFKDANEENLLDIAKRAGYDVLWLENDDSCKDVCDRVETEMMKERKSKHCFGNYCHDDILIDGLRERIRKINKNTLIVLHTMGSHGPTYYKRYPDKFKQFTPTCDTAQIESCSREAIVNTYNNTILYTDYVLSSIIDILKPLPHRVGMLYISDHGESLGEGGMYLHGFPYALAPKEQVEVPFIFWMPKDRCKFNINDLSHDNIFHSVLGLLRVQTDVYKKELDICR